MRKIFFFTLLLLAVFSCPYQAQAGERFNKLGRGLQNVITSPLELFLQPFRLVRVNHKQEQAFFIGIPQGIYFLAARCLTGVYETVSFPFGGGPVFYPETVFDGFRTADTGQWPYPDAGFGSPSNEAANAYEADPFRK